MKNTLITGGAGFIGSHLAEALIRAGRGVCVLDDLSTGNLQNLRAVEGKPNFRFVQGSVLEGDRLAELVEWSDEVYHLAGVVGVKLVIDDPIRTVRVNVVGTENVLKACHEAGKKVLIASTSEVYGRDIKSRASAFRETDDLSLGAALRWAYACSKAIDEYLAVAYHKKLGLPVVVVRIFNTVGPRQTGAYGMVIPRFVGQALSGQPITVYGDGDQVRSFILVDDTVRALVGLMDEPRALGQVFNVGGEEKVRIKDVARRIKEMTQSPSPIIFMPYEEAYGSGFEDIRFRFPDIGKIKSVLGFQPSFNLEQILERTIASHRENRETAR